MSTARLYGQLNPTSMMEEPYEYKYGMKPMGIDEGLKEKPAAPVAAELTPGQVGAKTAAQTMGAGGTIGQTLTGAGAGVLLQGAAGAGAMSGATLATGGGALAAGLALSLYEQNAQAEAAHDRAVADEANSRKVAVQNAIAGQMSAARMLGV
jgi:hypothetical protein